MTAKKRTKSKVDTNAVSVESTALLGLLADIRAAVGDPTGKLMQSELVEHCQKLREREHWGVGCTGLGEDFFLVALCENCGKPAVRLTEDGINLCRECYALCPEDTQNNADGEPRRTSAPNSP